MRKLTMTLTMLLCCCAAYGQSVPQWVVVHSLFLTRQTAPVPQTTVFTATTAGVYRVTAYWSETGKEANQTFTLSWTDIIGEVQQLNLGGVGESRVAPFMIVPKVGTAVTYVGFGTSGVYNVAYTIEQLQSSN